MVFEVDWSGARSIKMTPAFLASLSRLFSRAVPQGKGMRVTVSFVSALKMRTMNRLYRGFDRPTDVLSFSALEGERMPSAEKDFAGDVIICLPYVRTSAKEQKVPLMEEVVRMFVHGAMHCLGYDHMTKADADRMMPLQEELIKRIMKSYAA